MNLFSRISGSGQPLIILHGLYGSGDNWFTIARKFESRMTVHLIDARNHGHSPHSAEHSYPLMADDLKQYFQTHKIEKATIMGHSMGGKTAMLFALKYPDFVNKLIVADIAPVAYSGEFDKGQTVFHQELIKTLLSIDLKHLNSRDEAEKLLLKKTENKLLCNFLLKNLKFESNTWSWKINIEGLNRNLHLMMAGIEESAGYLPAGNKNFPVLFIKGEKSNYVPSSTFQKIYEIFPGAEIKEIKGASHWLHAEFPDEFALIMQHYIFS